MQLKKAERRKAKLRVGIFGPSGSGKTYSALLLAHGLVGDWEKIAVIDTERGSADLYSHKGDYNTLTLEPPFTPERYIQAIQTCIQAGMEAIIIDSISHEWEGAGGCLEIHDQMTGNSYTNWAKVTPRHNRFIDAILQSPVHMICCGRAKQDYVLQEKSGKQVPEKVGLKAVTREGFDYEVTLAFDLDIKHNATSAKDRTEMFIDKPPIVITEETGKQLAEWANQGVDPLEQRKKAAELSADIGRLMKEGNLEKAEAMAAIGHETLLGLSLDQLQEARDTLAVYVESRQIETAVGEPPVDILPIYAESQEVPEAGAA
jgi:hypothetical protein